MLKAKRIHENAKLPKKAHEQDAGYDLFCIENFTIPSEARIAVRTGLIIEVPKGYVGKIEPRSGLAVKSWVDPKAGVIDPGYTGEVMVILHNENNIAYEGKAGDKVAQILFYQVLQEEFEEVTDVADSERGTGGFASTGR